MSISNQEILSRPYPLVRDGIFFQQFLLEGDA